VRVGNVQDGVGPKDAEKQRCGGNLDQTKLVCSGHDDGSKRTDEAGAKFVGTKTDHKITSPRNTLRHCRKLLQK
jgi:hypothetical protein